MTIIFNKRTGKINSIFGGDLQTIDSLFGEEAIDYKLILDQIIIEDDINIFRNMKMYKVNPETKELELNIIN